MKSSDIFNLIERIAATSSKLEKQALIKEAFEAEKGAPDGLFTEVLKRTYDPFLVYSVGETVMAEIEAAVVPNPCAQMDDFSEVTFSLLDNLALGTLSGAAAIAAIAGHMSRLNPESATLLRRILLKDLRAGFSESTINTVIPGLIPEFPYMRCSLPPKSNMPKWDWKEGIISQEKADGMFANLNFRADGFITITSRQGTPFPLTEFGPIVKFFDDFMERDHQYHGELLVFKDGKVLPREQSNGMLNAVAQGGPLEKGCEIVYYIWDRIPMSAVVKKGKCEIGYSQRLACLLTLLARASVGTGAFEGVSAAPVRLIGTRAVRSKDDAYAHYRELLKQGKEGTICKHPSAIWKDGTSKDQVKLKLEVVVDLEVVGFNEGTGKNAGRTGSIQMASKCGLLKTDVSIRGEDMRDNVDNNKLDWLGSICSVKANSIMTPEKEGDAHALFLPIWVERRMDKREADTLQQVRDQFAAAVA